MANYLRALRQESVSDEAGTPIGFVASTEGIKRDGKSLSAGDWNLDNFKRNPVVLWVHDYMGRNLPVGRADVRVTDSELQANVDFDQEDSLATQIESKYRRGFLNAVSVGWDELIRCHNCGEDQSAYVGWFSKATHCRKCDTRFDEGSTVRNDLLDISAVPVPGDPDALMQRQMAAMRSFIDEMGDGDRIAVLTNEVTHIETEADVTDEDVWREVSGAMSRVLDANSQKSDEKRLTEYSNLARKYSKLKKEPPGFRTMEDLSKMGRKLRDSLFLEGELDLGYAVVKDPYERAGAVLSARNKRDLNQIISLAQGIMDRASKEDDAEERVEEDGMMRTLLGIQEAFGVD